MKALEIIKYAAAYELTRRDKTRAAAIGAGSGAGALAGSLVPDYLAVRTLKRSVGQADRYVSMGLFTKALGTLKKAQRSAARLKGLGMWSMPAGLLAGALGGWGVHSLATRKKK